MEILKVKISLACLTLWGSMDCIIHGNSLGQNTGVGSLSLLKVIFPAQASNPGLPNFRQTLYRLSHKGSQNGSIGRSKTTALEILPQAKAVLPNMELKIK